MLLIIVRDTNRLKLSDGNDRVLIKATSGSTPEKYHYPRNEHNLLEGTKNFIKRIYINSQLEGNNRMHTSH